ncbi:MAG: hypothetical protein NTU47_07925 [Ignavibacteriales bacterium]|nr:hypothetical protein [Ignavibacteriales bacterium]
MKTTIVASMLLLVCCLPLTALAQKESSNLVKNGDFEKFTGENPEGWDTSNIPGTLTVVSASKTCKSGTHAVKCEVKDFYGSIVAGFVCQKNLPTGGKDLHLSASYMVHAVGKDQAVIVLCFQNAAGSTIGTVEEYIEDTNSKWSEFSKEYKSPAGSALVHVRLTILPNKESERAHPGSFLICDDMKIAALTPPAPAEKPLIQ